MSPFWKKSKSDSEVKPSPNAFIEWAVGQDFFSETIDPSDRTQKLLSEIQKRSLADQVMLVSYDTESRDLEIISNAPLTEKILVGEKLLYMLLEKGFEENRLLFWEDFQADELLRPKLKKNQIESLLLSPLGVRNSMLDALLILNYSQGGEKTRITDFITFISSVLALSLQNVHLYRDLKAKSRELTEWTQHVEKRIRDGTKKVLEKELQYYVLFEGATDGILVHDTEGHILEANRVTRMLLGYEQKDITQIEWRDIADPGALESQMRFFNRVLESSRSKCTETALKKADGSTFTAEICSQRIRFKGSVTLQTFIRDVSVRKAVEDRLRETKDRYQVLVESSLVGAFVIRSAIILYTNEKFEELTGFSKSELLNSQFFNLIAPEDRSMISSRESRREMGEDVPEHYEVRFLNKEGGRWWGEVRNRRIRLEEKTAVLGNVVDITQRKRLEMQLLESQKMESIGTLAGGIAHDFNNLLGGILGYASLMLSDMSREHPYYDDIYTIAETAKKAADLTNRLLAFARGGKYQVTAVDNNRIVQDVVAILSRTIDRSIAIETHLVKNLWLIKGDSQQIHQAFLNICLNAVDAMPGGGKLTLATANVILDESFAQSQLGTTPGDYVRVTISDTGIGMDEKTKSRIFEPFFTTKPAQAAKGLGLSMVYGIVKNHEGTVIVDSILGKGTKFTLYFPRYKNEDIQTNPPPEAVQEKETAEAGILLIDDEAVIRRVARRMVEKGGYQVTVAHDGKEGVAKYKESPEAFDLVMLDLIMPEMNGVETAEHLREIDSDVKILFMSGYGLHDHPELSRSDEHDFIQKPFQTEVILQKIKDRLRS